MKTIELRLNSQRRFEHSDKSDDLKEKWAQHNFGSVLDVFHEAMKTCPPPKPLWVWTLGLFGCWMIESGIVYLLFGRLSSPNFIVLPALMYVTALILGWRQRALRIKFETYMIELCDRLNATENIRGIHYNFAIQRPRWYAPGRVSIYTLCINLDDRYQALTADSYTQQREDSYCVAIPDVAHVPQKLDTWDEKSYMYR
ncbi:hypothetical protein [Absidia glauca]|uniref:Uncharacterized protein n=1 Tax=Absidia glauca TaxID=4829 RepID=A0A163LP77_ABSGL|nr:hypothetical protein [Absidia glauca]